MFKLYVYLIGKLNQLISNVFAALVVLLFTKVVAIVGLHLSIVNGGVGVGRRGMCHSGGGDYARGLASLVRPLEYRVEFRLQRGRAVISATVHADRADSALHSSLLKKQFLKFHVFSET
jgi:hypothetical protein